MTATTVDRMDLWRRNELWEQAGEEYPDHAYGRMTRYNELLSEEMDKIPNPWGGA